MSLVRPDRETLPQSSTHQRTLTFIMLVWCRQSEDRYKVYLTPRVERDLPVVCKFITLSTHPQLLLSDIISNVYNLNFSETPSIRKTPSIWNPIHCVGLFSTLITHACPQKPKLTHHLDVLKTSLTEVTFKKESHWRYDQVRFGLIHYSALSAEKAM